MSAHDTMLEEFAIQCGKKGLDASYYVNTLMNTLSGEEVVAYIFGVGVAPENSNTLLDLIMITHDSVLGFNIEANRLIAGRTKKSMYNSILVNKNKNRIQVTLSQGGPTSPGYYINNLLVDEEKMWEFVRSAKQYGVS